MCGLAGTVRFDGDSVDPFAIDQMSHVLQHRGPDDLGYLGWSNSGGIKLTRQIGELVGSDMILAHRRLSIIDLSEAGRQPMSTEDGLHHIVFNGEIYNFLELRRELEKEGIRFVSDSDTEVLLKALARRGLSVLQQLIGMFAFCYVNLQQRKIYLVRDFFGIKPMYYAADDRRLHFASEIKALLTQPDVGHDVHPRALDDYLRYGEIDASEQTLIRSIRRIKPGHYVEFPINSGKTRIVNYWKTPASVIQDISMQEAATHLRDLFVDSVRLHLRSDVAIATCLSGGVDSSAIVMVMRELCAKSLEIHTFSYISDDPAISEEKWVDIVSRAAGTISHKVRPTTDEFERDLEAYLSITDEPIGWFNSYAHNRLFQEINKFGIKVSLDGQGADEQLCGYGNFWEARLRSLVRAGRWIDAWRFLACQHGTEHPENFAKTARAAASRIVPKNVKNWMRGRPGIDDSDMVCLNRKWFEERGVNVSENVQAHGSNRSLHELLAESFNKTSLPRLLRTGDRHSMAHSVESRVPFLTPQIVEFCMSLPEQCLVDDRGVRKAVFRESMVGIVPDKVLNRHDKVAFATPNWPLERWHLVERILKRHADRPLKPLRGEGLRLYFDDLRATRRSNFRPAWRVLNLMIWADQNNMICC